MSPLISGEGLKALGPLVHLLNHERGRGSFGGNVSGETDHYVK